MDVALDPARVSKLFSLFQSSDPYPSWRESFSKELTWAQQLDDASFLIPESQEHLWRARGISGIGPGEAVNVRSAYADPEVARALLVVRKSRLPEHADQRAHAIQEHYDRILAMVHPKHSTMRPQTKLARLFVAILPREMTTAFTIESARHVCLLLLGRKSLQPIEAMVLTRQRLREVAGPESGHADDVLRSMFCWWLHENYETIVRGQDPIHPDPAHAIDPFASPKQPALALLPVTKQRKGLAAIGGYLETWRAVVSAARNGATPDDIVSTMRTVFGLTNLSEKSCRMVFNDVRNNQFLEFREGLWYPSETGERLVDEDPPDVIVERFLRTTYGVPQVLRILRDGPKTRQQLFAEQKRKYPAWKVDFGPNSQLQWARSLGLVLDTNGRFALSDYGAAWEERLPEDLPDPEVPGTGAPLVEFLDEGASEPATTAPVELAFADVIDRMKQDLPDFVLDEDQLRSLHVAWHCHPGKRFVLLSGLSGTGKTAMLVAYARAYASLRTLDPDQQLVVVPVSPDWRDPSGLLGYHNPLHADATWQKEPALRILLEARLNPERPYFLVLDEMNLAQVEQYFAPFLSAMETRGEIHLHQEPDEVNGVPGTVRWPTNLFIGGTLNMDETTHSVSDKVLDRAFTLEFWEVDLERYLAQRKVAPEHADLLLKLHASLARVRRHFGYRTASEWLSFVQHADATQTLVDQAVFSKILPRLRGEETPAFAECLREVRALCERAGLTRSAAKVSEMEQRLQATGVARFWA